VDEAANPAGSKRDYTNGIKFAHLTGWETGLVVWPIPLEFLSRLPEQVTNDRDLKFIVHFTEPLLV
jgi:hypothetical protein